MRQVAVDVQDQRAAVVLPDAGRALVVMIVVGVMLTLVGAASQVYRYTHMPHRTFGLLDLNVEASIGTWYSAGLLLAGAVLCGLNAAAGFQGLRALRWGWLGLALVFAMLSMDEVVGFHERTQGPLRDRFGLEGVLYFSWIVLAVPAVLGMTLVYWRFLWTLPRTTTKRLLMAAALFLGGAIGMEMLGGMQASAHGQENLTFALLAHVEELLEMLGAAVFVHATWRHLMETTAGLTWGQQETARAPAGARTDRKGSIRGIREIAADRRRLSPVSY